MLFYKLYCNYFRFHLFILFISISNSTFSQYKDIDFGELRINCKGIIDESSLKLTNGECYDYLRDKIGFIEKKYGKESREYVCLEKYFLDFVARVFNPAGICYTGEGEKYSNEYFKGREELVRITKKVFGENSYLYGDAIQFYLLNFLGVCSPKLTQTNAKNLLELNAISNIVFRQNNTMDSGSRNIYIASTLARRADIYYKIGRTDSALYYYQETLKWYDSHPNYDYYFPALIELYSSLLSLGIDDLGLKKMIQYEPIIENKYGGTSEIYYKYLRHLVTLAISANQIGRGNFHYLTKAKNLCEQLYTESSTEYLDFLIKEELQAYKKLGFKSTILYILKSADIQISNNAKLLKDNLFFDYNYEWYKYYQSLGQEDLGIKYLLFVEQSFKGRLVNANNKTGILKVLDEVYNYYVIRNQDSAEHYLFKILDIEKELKNEYGNYVIHQYNKIAKYYVGFDDSLFAIKSIPFCELALKEFQNAYGKNSDYYTAALYTLGKAKFIISKGKQGREDMYADVYRQLNDTNFIPGFNGSVFDSYANVLNTIGVYDSADFFNNEVYLRNPSFDLFSIIGVTTTMQNNALNEIYRENYSVLTKHLIRYFRDDYKFVSKELAEKIFKKNIIYKVQRDEINAIKQLSLYDTVYQELIKSRKKYDSIIFADAYNKYLADSARYVFEQLKIQAFANYANIDLSILSSLDYSYDKVIERLNKDECFLDIVRFTSGKILGDQIHYAIILIDKHTKDKIKYYFIKDGVALEQYSFYEDYRGLSTLLSELIIDIKRYNKIFINPDGVFNLINFYALNNKELQYLIKNQTFVYVNSFEGIGNDYYRFSNNATIGFFGDPEFPSKGNYSEFRSSIFDGYNFKSLKELPYTRLEIQDATDILSNKGWLAKSFLRSECSEKNFMKNNKFDVIHIASHGFFCDKSMSYSNDDVFRDNPYLKSGLILGKKDKTNVPGIDNVLTSYEVLNLDLRNTSLIVLSACETAKGESNPGQGLYGLQRAFKIAGAKSLLVSTRKVSDRATRLLMKYFYSHIANGEGIVASFRNAQLDILADPLYDDPKLWGGFLLISQ